MVDLPVPGHTRTPLLWEAGFRAELQSVLPVWERFQILLVEPPVSPVSCLRHGRHSPLHFWMVLCRPCQRHDTPALALRFLADDLKALRQDARQIDWDGRRQTVAGELLIAL